MVPPTILYINQNLIIQQISAKMNTIQFEIIENKKLSERRLIQRELRQIKSGLYEIEDGDEEIVEAYVPPPPIEPIYIEHFYANSSDNSSEFTGHTMQEYKPPIKDSLDFKISNLMDNIKENDRRRRILADELKTMTFKSTEYNIQKQILVHTRKLRDHYQTQLSKLLLDRHNNRHK